MQSLCELMNVHIGQVHNYPPPQCSQLIHIMQNCAQKVGVNDCVNDYGRYVNKPY